MKFLKNVFFTLVVLSMFLVILEVAVRFIYPEQNLPSADRIELSKVDNPAKGEKLFGRLFQGCLFSYNTFEKDREGLILNRAGSRGIMLRTNKMNYVYDLDRDAGELGRLRLGEGKRATFKINQRHLRGAEVQADNRPRLLMLGDSITFGYYVNDDETYAAQLETILSRRNRPYQVLNSGVSSYNARDEWRYLKKYGRELRPRVVGIGFYLNDIFLLGKPLMVKEYNFFFPYRKIPGLWRLGNKSRLIGLVYERLLTLPYFLRASIDVNRPENISVENAWWEYYRILRGIKEYSEKNNFQLFLVIFPNAFQLGKPYTTVFYQERLKKITRQLAIPTLDLLPVFSRSDQAYYHSNDTVHPNALGHAAAARAIAEFLIGNKLLAF